MEQEKSKIKRWKKITAFVISAIISIPFIQETAHAAEEFGNAGLLSEKRDMQGENEEAAPSAPHEHQWDYSGISPGSANGVITCNGNQGGTVCLLGDVVLTLISGKDENGHNKVALLANGQEVENGNEWGIQYEIRYFREGSSEIWTENDPPEIPGAYKVRAFFGGREDLYLQAEDEYVIEHEHSWSYEKISENTTKITCSGNGECEDSAGGIEFTLNVEKESKYEEADRERVNLSANILSANGEKVPVDLDTLNGWGISWNLVYYKGADGAPVEQEPQDAGKYRVKVVFEGGVTLEDTFEIGKVELVSGQVVMNSYTYGDNKAKSPSVKGMSGIKEITYWYYKGNENPQKLDVKNFNAKTLNAGTYYIDATFIRAGDEDHTYRTDRTRFTVYKADRKVKLTMESYGLKCKNKPEPRSDNIEKGVKVFYKYKRTNEKKWTTWEKGKTNKRLKSGTYQMYVYVQAGINYKALKQSEPITFTVYADHDWNLSKMPKGSLSARKQKKDITCEYCKTKAQVILPPKTMNIALNAAKGSTAAWLNGKNGAGCTFAIDKKSPNKSYIKIDKKGKLTANAKDYARMQLTKPVKVKVVSYGKTYAMNVKLKIGRPKVTIRTARITLGGVTGHKFIFQYDVPGADRITVSMDHQTAQIRRELDEYVSSPRSTSESYINLSDAFLRTLNNKVTFRITAYYGKNRSETQVVSVKIR